MHLTNLKGFPQALVDAVRNDPYESGGDISVTRLIDAPQRRILKKQHHDAIVEDVGDRIWSLLGQAVHTILERANSSDIVEKRLYAEMNGWRLSGQFDRLDLHNKTLDDYKVTTTYKADGDIQWERQLNVLRWLAEMNGHEVNRLRIIAIFRDWSYAKAEREPGYPRQAVGIIEVPVWSFVQAQQYVAERIDLHRKAEGGEVPECTHEERWYQGSKWAIVKIGGKRATKLYESKEEAEQEIGDGYELVERKGSYRRCEQYCEVANFCNQWKKENQGE